MSGRHGRVLDFAAEIRRYLKTQDGMEGILNRAIEMNAVRARYGSAIGPGALMTQDVFRDDVFNDPLFKAAVEDISKMYGRGLSGAPYFVEREITDLIENAASKLDALDFRVSMLPTDDGVVLFDRPILIPTTLQPGLPRPPGFVDDVLINAMHGFMWNKAEGIVPHDGERPRTLLAREEDLGASSQPVTAFMFLCSSEWSNGNVEPTGISIFREDDILAALDTVEEEPTGVLPYTAVTSRDALRMKIKTVGAFLLFINQRVLTYGDRPADRPARRRAEQFYRGNVPDVKVIALRRADSGKHASDYGHRRVDWACQWLVGGETGGFWRRYPNAPEHDARRIWVFPFWKGPADAPVKLPDKILFHVRR